MMTYFNPQHCGSGAGLRAAVLALVPFRGDPRKCLDTLRSNFYRPVFLSALPASKHCPAKVTASQPKTTTPLNISDLVKSP